MVNWKTVRAPKQHGGLGIRDPRLENFAMGAKMYWNMITNSNQWWIQVMAKYLIQQKDREGREDPGLGSPVWKLINSSMDTINKNLRKVLGNASSIKIFTNLRLETLASTLGHMTIIGL